MTTAPAARSRVTTAESAGCGVRAAFVPFVVGSPAIAMSSLTAIGTPRNGRSPSAASAASACASACSANTSRKAPSRGSIRSMRRRYRSTSSREVTSPDLIARACAATPANTSSVMARH
nr:hypothetical protein [Lentzea guizhouensis]